MMSEIQDVTSLITQSSVNEILFKKSEKLNDYLIKCESKLSHEDLYEYKSKIRFLKKTFDMIVVNKQNIERLIESQKIFKNKHVRTNLYVMLSFVFSVLVLYLFVSSVYISVCLMSGLILFWMMDLFNRYSIENEFLTKLTSYEILQKSLERDFEEFNLKGSSYDLRNLMELNLSIQKVTDSILREEFEFKHQILYLRLMIHYLRKYSSLEEIIKSNEFFEVLKGTNNEELKKVTN